MAATVHVRYFAAARERVGASTEDVVLDRAPVSARVLLELLAARHSRLAPVAGRMRLAVNGELVEDSHPVHPGDAIDVLPPVAGGAGRLCALRDAPLSVDECLAAVQRPGAGGIALFVGTVRDEAAGTPVSRLDYEAHTAMAERELGRIMDEIEARDPTLRLAAVHRTGELGVGELAGVVAASAPHRAEAFAACRKLIERLKERVPIWKKEWTSEADARWVNLET
jgi:molybdopterin synthase catalytic subunit